MLRMACPNVMWVARFATAWYERVVDERPFQFEWDDGKANANARKHGVTFELAASLFFDPSLLTIADVEHSETEERWLSIGIASNGVLLTAAYLWSEDDQSAVKIRIISARRATQTESEQYRQGL